MAAHEHVAPDGRSPAPGRSGRHTAHAERYLWATVSSRRASRCGRFAETVAVTCNRRWTVVMLGSDRDRSCFRCLVASSSSAALVTLSEPRHDAVDCTAHSAHLFHEAPCHLAESAIPASRRDASRLVMRAPRIERVAKTSLPSSRSATSRVPVSCTRKGLPCTSSPSGSAFTRPPCPGHSAA
jgi:hypothetical protein